MSKSEMLRDLHKRHAFRHSVYIGDTRGDKKAAEEAGMDFIGASYGFGNVSDAPHRYDSFTEIFHALMA